MVPLVIKRTYFGVDCGVYRHGTNDEVVPYANGEACWAGWRFEQPHAIREGGNQAGYLQHRTLTPVSGQAA